MSIMIKEILTRGGHQVVGEANNGLEAIKKFTELKPDLVIMDIVMPEMDGITALTEIRKLDHGARILMCSSMEQKAILTEAFQAGAREFILKPFHSERLLNYVNNMLETIAEACEG